MKTAWRLVSGTALAFLLILGVRTLPAQDTNSGQSVDGVTQSPATVEKPDPLKRTLTDKEKIAQQKALRGELHGVYKKWVDEDVRVVGEIPAQQCQPGRGCKIAARFSVFI